MESLLEIDVLKNFDIFDSEMQKRVVVLAVGAVVLLSLLSFLQSVALFLLSRRVARLTGSGTGADDRLRDISSVLERISPRKAERTIE
jgi:hypothetical protein